jgi:hypothetical protein
MGERRVPSPAPHCPLNGPLPPLLPTREGRRSGAGEPHQAPHKAECGQPTRGLWPPTRGGGHARQAQRDPGQAEAQRSLPRLRRGLPSPNVPLPPPPVRSRGLDASSPSPAYASYWVGANWSPHINPAKPRALIRCAQCGAALAIVVDVDGDIVLGIFDAGRVATRFLLLRVASEAPAERIHDRRAAASADWSLTCRKDGPRPSTALLRRLSAAGAAFTHSAYKI